MRHFLRTGIEILLVINAVAWMFPLFEEANNRRRLPVDAVVVESRRVEESIITPQGGSALVQSVEVRAAYAFAGARYEIAHAAGLLNGKPKSLAEIESYYSPGKEILVWVDPSRPHDASLHREITTYVLPLIFLGLLLITLVFYVGLKND